MSLREEMRKLRSSTNFDYYKTDYGQFSRWWRMIIYGMEIRHKEDTYIDIMLDTITSDEELELLWAQWNIEREN